jgi:hypothetical protein
MIVVLHDSNSERIANDVIGALREAYGEQLHIQGLKPDQANAWPEEASWDDLIIALFATDKFTDHEQEFLRREFPSKMALPVALSDLYKAPPSPLTEIKALGWYAGSRDPKGRLVRRVGSLIGLRLRARNQSVFISYRAADGSALAAQIEGFLNEHGYRIWRDESRDEFDDEGNILAGEDVQKVIDENLASANVLVLLDTPEAAASRWIKIEVDRANGQLIPVFPLLFLLQDERRRTSRFRSLATLQRGCEFQAADGTSALKLSADDLDHILVGLEEYLSEIFQRRLRVPFLVEKEFTSRGYDWTNRDRFIYEALSRSAGVLRTRVFSHCSYFEGVYDPALLAFIQHLENTRPRSNYALYVYDGQEIPEAQIEEIRRAAKLEDATDIIILHHREIGTLLTSNFQRLRT